jgi:hypothetical protein
VISQVSVAVVDDANQPIGWSRDIVITRAVFVTGALFGDSDSQKRYSAYFSKMTCKLHSISSESLLLRAASLIPAGTAVNWSSSPAGSISAAVGV